MADLLFVYGTLRPALCPESVRPWLTQSSLLGSGSVAGRLYDLGPHPAAVLDPTAESRIVGEVLSLAGDQLRALDEYEGYDPDRPETSYYVRVSCRVKMAGGGELTCWVYLPKHDVGAATPLPHGDYVLWRQQAAS